jgi:hypothetical protein
MNEKKSRQLTEKACSKLASVLNYFKDDTVDKQP